ncbi:hypothetical protein FWG76_00590 [Candidatus Saccharibacteria bacterium]|nr:hypothetical protein [Candidatus Saccharibacteria bacterium]
MVDKIGQKGLVKGLALSLMAGSIFAGLSIATSVAMFARVTPTLVSPFGLLFSGIPPLLMWISFGLAAILLAIVPFIVVKKITDGDAVKESFSTASRVLWAVAALNAFLAFATLFISLFSAGIEGISESAAEAMQKQYWLGTFVPVFMAAGVNAASAFFVGNIAKGKMALMNTFKIVNIGIAGLAIVMMLVANMVVRPTDKSSRESRAYWYSITTNMDLSSLIRGGF